MLDTCLVITYSSAIFSAGMYELSYHLPHETTAADGSCRGHIHQFLQMHLRYWVEALSYMRKVRGLNVQQQRRL